MSAPDADVILKPGGDPPFVVPFCASCNMPVERFTIDPVSSVFRMSIQAECHGKTEGAHVSVDELFERKRTGRKIVMFRRPGANTVR